VNQNVRNSKLEILFIKQAFKTADSFTAAVQG
jgi:hypothetical protein